MITKNQPPFSKFLLGFFFILFIHPLFSQTPFLVKDFNKTKFTIGNETITHIAETDNFACFFADDGRHGNELWITDGTPYGTRLLKDILPGEAGSGSSLVNFCRQGNVLFFPIKSGINSTPELWKTDGTPEGTTLVSQGPFAQEPEEITALGNKILFKTLETDGGLNYILWVSDGTAIGTKQIKKFDLPFWVPFSFTPYKDGLIFAGRTKANGVELWKTDGTTNGTVLIKDIYTGSMNSNPGIFTVCKDKVYFRCTHPDYGNQIWMTDGTESGTTLLKQLTFNTIGAEPTDLKMLNDSLYFVAFNENFQRILWVSDGTENNTLPLKTSMPGQTVPGINDVFLCDSFLITTVFKENSWELWRKNGANGNYFKIKEYNTSAEGNNPTLEQRISENNHFFFSYRTSSDAIGRLWITDGTENGTRFLKNIAPLAGYGNQFYLFSIFANDLYFSSDLPNYGFPLCKSDGTPEGTLVIKDIKNENNSNLFAYLPASIADTLFFTSHKSPLKNELWRTMGSGNNTNLVAEIEGNVPAMSILDGSIYITTYNHLPRWALWKYNTAGTQKTELAGGLRYIRNDFLPCNGKLFFSAESYANGSEPWVTDGTPNGTKMLMDINPGADGSNPESFMKSDSHLFFFAINGITGSELWAMDVSTNVPVLMKEIIPGNYLRKPLALGIKGGEFYFTANSIAYPKSTELWKSNGTIAGTVMIGKIPIWVIPGTNGTVLFKDHFYFSAEDETHGKELWRTDGTIAGTTLVKDINTVSSGSGAPYAFLKADSILLFYAYTPETGFEPWRSDGSTAGTNLIKDINQGNNHSDQNNKVVFYPYKGKVYFGAQEAGNKQNIWVTNGSGSGTYSVSYLEESEGYLVPDKFFSTTSVLFSTAKSYFNQKGYGEELWSFRFCNDSILSLPATTDISFNHQSLNDTASCRCNILGELMDKVISNGAKPITGKIISKVWIQETEPTGYVNKVYEILPENKDSMATGNVTLYFTQEDFDAFNEINDNQLPKNPIDSAGISNLYVELRKGESKNGSGLPVSFRKQMETIHPGLDKIQWDSSLNRWEIEVAVTQGFGGFYVKADSCLLSESFTWRGSNSEDWANENNWLERAKPSMGADIIIPSYRHFYPLISQNIVIRKLQLEKGATLKINSGVVIDINEKICR